MFKILMISMTYLAAASTSYGFDIGVVENLRSRYLKNIPGEAVVEITNSDSSFEDLLGKESLTNICLSSAIKGILRDKGLSDRITLKSFQQRNHSIFQNRMIMEEPIEISIPMVFANLEMNGVKLTMQVDLQTHPRSEIKYNLKSRQYNHTLSCHLTGYLTTLSKNGEPIKVDELSAESKFDINM